MWQAAETQQAEGDACISDQADCPVERGNLQRVTESTTSQAAIHALFASAVLPGWVRRCGTTCAENWNAVAGPVLGAVAHR